MRNLRAVAMNFNNELTEEEAKNMVDGDFDGGSIVIRRVKPFRGRPTMIIKRDRASGEFQRVAGTDAIITELLGEGAINADFLARVNDPPRA